MQNDMRDRLVELLGNRCCSKQIPCEICEYQNFGDCHKYALAEHLIANGVIVPPCNIGDVVYSIRTDTKVIYSCSVCEFIINKHFENIHKECKVYIIEDGRFTYFDFSSFGKTVFFTKEEAEQKLKELSENNG
jgi:hypothetical protein